ncbi:unnamed protein product [Larinioides sclopetarius]|uniref:Cadherin domain-containing protein n=1 Tax=Larinioides sclopetarius TaxID=280406 RepID=A0AAV1ZK93_9ARAC
MKCQIQLVQIAILVTLGYILHSVSGQACLFYPLGENRRFERVEENIAVGSEVFRVQVYPRHEFKLEPVDNSLSDINFFRVESIDNTTVSIKVAKSLEDLVDRRDPQTVLKFKLTCKGGVGTDEAFLPVTVYIQDINDHAPEFQNTPYYLEVDELTPVGLTVFRGLHAIDKDKPNTPNSDVTYSIVGGNENNSFALSDPIEGILVVNKPLDYDYGSREFKLLIQASDHGSPESKSSVTTMTIRLKDSDDQNPIFTKEVYKTHVLEAAAITGARIRVKLSLDPPIHAYDQDVGVNAPLRYSIIQGNEKGLFEMHDQMADLYLVKEIDRESLKSPILTLHIQATQTDNNLRTATAKVDVQVLDVNDNVPEFEYEMYNITVMENLPPGFTVVQVSAFDEDSGDNAEFRYELEDESGAFSIDPTGGSISVKDPSKLDRETKDVIRMRVFAKEKKPNVNPNAKNTPAVVEVHLLDANDNNPQFVPSSVYVFSATEVDEPGSVVGQVIALDPDLDINGVVRYRRQNDSLSQTVPFDVHPENGSIYILESFRAIREKPARYTFFVQASDLARIESERRSSVAVVNVNIKDINNNAPEFIGAPYEAFIGESLPPGALVYQLQAKDPDADTVLEFSIVAGNDEGNFVVNPSTGQVLTAAVMDYEKKQSYDLLVQVADGINTAVSPMTVNVVDINDQQPVFTHSYYNFSIVEEMQENVTVGSILALDGDSGRNAIVRYKILGEQAQEAFEIDEAGNILSRRRLDREKEAMIDFLVVAFDAGTPQLSGTATVGVRVEDINDSPPYFDSDTYVVSVPEEEIPPYTVHKMHAKDDDTGENAVLKYLIVGGNEDKMFQIDEDTGVVTTSDKLNYERQSEYVLHVAARNVKPFQGPQASALANPFVKLVIKVMDVNDELVVFDRQSYQFRIPENLPRSERIGYLNATNLHRSAKDQSILYWIGDGNSQERFWINPRSGELVLTETVDRDPPNNQQVFQLRVFARDQLSSNTFNTSVPVVIVIDDVNDNTPTFDEERYALELPENLPLGTTLPPFFRAKDIDAGPNGKIERYYTNGSDDVFLVNNATGAITLVSNLDYEANDQHEFTVFAVDGGRPARIGSANVVIKVQNINEFAPDFVGLPYDFRAEESAVRGTKIGHVKAYDGDGDKIKYSLSGGDTAFFMIDEDTGVVYVKKDLDARTRFSFIARATDDGVPQNNSIGVQVNVWVRERNDHPPVFTKLSYYGTVTEKQVTDKPVVKVSAIDRDLQNNTVTYSIKNGNEEGIFELHPSSGEIFVKPSEAHRVDYDQTKSYSLLIEAKDSHTTSLYGLAMATVDVIDTNDHPPVFSQMSYSASLAENLPAGHCFLQIHAESGDSVDTLSYAVDRNTIPFTVNPKTGYVCTKQVLDREEKDTYEFVVIALDGRYETKSPVVIRILDQNDNPPKFERERYFVSIPPHAQAGRTIIQVLATDPDTGSNGEVTYWIKNSHGHFEIDSQTGHIRLSSVLPTPMQKNMTYEMEIFARDHGAASNIGKATLVVRVSSTRNHPPKFEKFGYRVAVDENAANVDLLTVHAYDPDSGPAGRLRYRIVRSTRREAFRIDGTSGRITLVTPLDYEKTKYLELQVEARDESKEPQFATTVVQVSVNDLNDNAPEFLALPHLLRVPLSTSLSEVVYTVKAIDADSTAGGNNLITYELQPPSSQFSINRKTGQITPSQPLSPSTETLRIKATDGSNIPLSSTVDLLVEVYKDTIDDPTPVFTSVQYSVNADGILEAGTTVLDVRATVPNGSPVYYNITGPEDTLIRGFNIDRETGRITTTTRLSAEQETLYHFLVAASNRNDASKGVEAGVVVQLSDASIRCPKFPFSEYFTAIRENASPDSVVLPYLQVEDAHIFDRLSYQITEDNSNDNFYIDTLAFNVSAKIKKPLDRDTMPMTLQGMYTLTVTASNQRCSGNTRLNIFVEDVNDNSPVFEKKDFLVEVKENAPPGHVVVHLTALDKDELDMNKLRYFIIDGNSEQQFQIEESTGVLSVRSSPDREETPVFSLRVLALDSANNTGFANIHVTILDENDWTPTFMNETFLLNVTEGSSSLGASIRLPVVDYDEGPNRQMELLILEGNIDNHFRLSVDDRGPLLTVVKELDREEYGVPDSALHVVVVGAKDMGVPPRTGTATVAVVIQDINDSPPEFAKDVYYEFVSESEPVGSVVTTLTAKDEDAEYNTNMKYAFGSRTRNVPFFIDPFTGAVNISRTLDVSESREYSIIVEASDGLWKAATTLKLFIREAAERDPLFDQQHFRFAVAENLAGAYVGQVELKERMYRSNSMMQYNIVNNDVKELFNITKEGKIFTKLGLDREKRSQHTFTVMLEERKPSTKVTVCEVTVEVMDVNDEIPTFQHSYTGTINENAPSGTPVTVEPPISAIDNDSGNNSVVRYSLSGAGSELFKILESGQVIFNSPDPILTLDRERKERYDLQVTATDMGNLSSSTYLTINIADENDNAPVFQHGPLRVMLPETARPGSKIAEVNALDADAKGPNSKVEYIITAGDKGDVRIDRATGEIYVVSTLRPGTVYLLNVSAADGKGLAASTVVNITVVDVNDHKPTFSRYEYTFKVKEGNYSHSKKSLGVLKAVDEDTGNNGMIEYSLVTTTFEQKFPFTVDSKTGELFAQGIIDRESKSSYKYQVLATDFGEPQLNSTAEVIVEVIDVNDEPPRFYTDPYLAHVQENLDPGQKVTQITAYDSDSGNNGLVFYKLGLGHNNKFYIDSKDGTVWTLSTLDYEKQAFYNMTVIAYDQGTPSLSSTAKLWVTVADTNDAVPEFSKAVYTLEVAESRQPGDTVFKLDAGKGDFKYALLNTEEIDAFDVDSSTGDIRLVKALDSVQQSHYRLLVEASVDSDPPKSDTAEVNIIVGTGHGVRLFPSRLYEVTVFENRLAPLVVLDLNATDEIAHKPVLYSIVGHDYNGLFVMEADTGRLTVTASLDREKRDRYSLKVRAENVGRHRFGREISRSGPIRSTESYHLAFDEALVVIEVGDENDNAPVFEVQGRPIVAAVPLEASFGYQVLRITAKDADMGYNSAIRYEIIRKPEDASTKFHIDPVSGVVRSMVTFALDGGRIYGFDVKATDREGSENGHSAVANVFVYVLPETKLVLFVAGRTPLAIEQHVDKILSYLSNLTGYDVKMAKLEPHHDGEYEDRESTDLFLYAVHRDTNDIVDTETLLNALEQRSELIVSNLDSFNIQRIQGVSVQEKISQMGTTEIAIIALSSVIFLGAVLGIALLCSSCKKRKVRRRHTSWEQQRLYNIKNPLMGKSIGNPYGSRSTPNGTVDNIKAAYANGDLSVPDYNDSLGDNQSMKRNNRRSRQQVPPDGASSLNPSNASPKFEKYNKNDSQWYDMRDGADSM